MKMLLLFLAGLLIAGATAFAQKISFGSDSLIDQTDFKHDKQFFLDHYGNDDSTRALINTFFRVRRAAAVEVAISVVAGIGLYLFVDHVFSPGDKTGHGYGTVFLAIFAVPLIPGFAVGIGEGTITYLIYSRQKLLHLIANYQLGKHLPGKFTHRIRFKQEFKKVSRLKA